MVQKSGIHQLSLLIYPVIYWVLHVPGGCLGFLPSTVNMLETFPRPITRIVSNMPRAFLGGHAVWYLANLENCDTVMEVKNGSLQYDRFLSFRVIFHWNMLVGGRVVPPVFFNDASTSWPQFHKNSATLMVFVMKEGRMHKGILITKSVHLVCSWHLLPIQTEHPSQQKICLTKMHSFCPSRLLGGLFQIIQVITC